MQIDRRITNGLAWAGAALVVAIPVADYVSGTLMGSGAPQLALVQEEKAPVPATRPVDLVAAKPAPQAPAAEPAVVAKPEVVEAAATTPPAAQAGDAVDAYLQSGKPLPSYISEGGAATQPTKPAANPAAPVQTARVPAAPAVETTRPAVESAPVEVASVTPQHIAPVPMPLSMRPKSVSAIPVAVAQPQPSYGQDAPLIIDQPEPVITADDLDDWESGPLSDFLARRDGGRQAQAAPDNNYDANGFFLDEGPNSSARFQRFPPGYRDDDVIYLAR